MLKKLVCLLSLVLSSAACGDHKNDRPTANEMSRRVALLTPVLLGHQLAADVTAEQIAQLTCFLNDDYKSVGYQLGAREKNDLPTTVAAALTACPTDRFDDLADGLAILMGADPSLTMQLVAKGRAAIGL